MSSQENTVGGEGQICNALLAPQQRDQSGQIVSQEGLTSGQSELLHTKISEDAD
jgi:hypothetical protein